MSKWIVAGGGFQGVVAASALAKAGNQVALVERAPFLGGVLYPAEHDGLFLDNGCHLFSAQDADLAEFFFEILGNSILPVDVQYASIIEGVITAGTAAPSFLHLPLPQRIRTVYDILSHRAAAPDNLEDELLSRFGPNIASRVHHAVRKITGREPKELSASTAQRLQISSAYLFAPSVTRLLRKSKKIKRSLAFPSRHKEWKIYQGEKRRYPFMSFYPLGRGLRTFCTKAETYLNELGVSLRLKTAITGIRRDSSVVKCETNDGQVLEADSIVWASDPNILAELIWGESPLKKYNVTIPLVLYYFLLPKDTPVRFTYLHDFDEDARIFRLSSPGFYGQQFNDRGLSYICAEVPVQIGGDIWKNPEKYFAEVWDEAMRSGMVPKGPMPECKIRKAPVSYPVQLAGFESALANMRERLSSEYPEVVISGPTRFSKKQIVGDLSERLAS